MIQNDVSADEDLIARTLDHDENAYDQLMRRHANPVRLLIAHYFQDRTLVDDLAQETFAKAYFALKDYRGNAPFIFWLKQIAVRLCMDELRRRKSQRELVTTLEQRGPGRPAARNPAERLNARLFLNELLSNLSPVDRMILILLDGEGHSVAEVAQLTGLTRANVKVRAFRIRRRLRAQGASEVTDEEPADE
jgi:RNA polymerase sigma-70 factor (ECF subfamily)